MAVAAGSRKPASMRACARVALALMAVFGLAGCGAIDDLREAMSRWYDVAEPPGGPGGFFADHLPNATPMIRPKKSLKNEASKASKTLKKKDKPASKVQRAQTAEPKLPTYTIEAPKPQAAEPQSVRHLPTPPARGLATGVHGDGVADENALRTFQGKSVTFSTAPSGVISGTKFGSNYQFSPNWLNGAEDELSRPRFR